MKQSDAIRQLSAMDQTGRYVYHHKDLEKLFHDNTPSSFEATLKRLVANQLLERVLKGIYVYALSRHKGPDTLELIARTLRRGEHSYISLESALSEYGLISQIPVDRLTIMTTGRKGEYSTPYGTLEFTHTSRPISDILASVRGRERPLNIATKEAALRDLRRVGRNLHLIDSEH